MKMKKLSIVVVILGSVFTIACSNDSDDRFSGNTQTSVVTTNFTTFDGAGEMLEGENEISDMKACLFENGKMTHVFDNLEKTEKGYKLELEHCSGTLYLLANTAGIIDLYEMKNQNVNEAEWMKTVITPSNEKTTHFFTGVVSMDESSSNNNYLLTMKRGVARFDLKINSLEEILVEKLELTNVAQSAYLFPQDGGKLSPENVSWKNITVDFIEALSTNHSGVLYVYEQENSNIQLIVTLLVNGKRKEIVQTLSTSLKRNTVYTITVRKDWIDVWVDVSLEDWENGSDTEIVPFSGI